MISLKKGKVVNFKKKTVVFSNVENSIFIKASFPLINNFILRFLGKILFRNLWNDDQLFSEKIREKIDGIEQIVFWDPKNVIILRKGNKKILSDIIRIISEVYTKDKELIDFRIGEFKEEQFEQLETPKICEEIQEGIIKRLPSQNLV